MTRRFPPQHCGVGDYVAELGRFLQSQGEHVCVLTEPLQGQRPSDLPLVELPMRGWRDLLNVYRAIVKEAPDAVQLEYSQYGWHSLGCAFWLNALFLALRSKGISLRLALHEVPIVMRQHPLQLPVALLQRIHFWLLGAVAQDICTNTCERVTRLRRWFPWRKDAVRYRPNSNCNPVFDCAAGEREELRRKCGVPKSGLVAAVYGFFGNGKNTAAAIEAVARLRGQLPVQLWLLGDTTVADPTHVSRLRALAAPLGENAYWSGPLSPREVSLHLQATDIFLLPQPDGHLTRSGSFMAAAAHGLPVIAVRADRNQAEFTHGQNVWLVRESDSSCLERAVAHLARDPKLRAQLANNVRLLYQSRFDWPHTQIQSGIASQGVATFPCESKVVSPTK